MVDKKKVYIASPYWNKDPEVRARNVQRQIHMANALIALDFLPFWPLHSHYLAHDGVGRNVSEERWLAISSAWIEDCDYLLRLPGESKGADVEVRLAEALDIPVLNDLTELILL